MRGAFALVGLCLLAMACSAAPPRVVAPLRQSTPTVTADEAFRAHPPPLADVVEASDPVHVESSLANGLRVVSVERREFPVVVALLLIDRGGLDLGDAGSRKLGESAYLFARGGDESVLEKTSLQLAATGSQWLGSLSSDALWDGVRTSPAAFDESLGIVATRCVHARLSPGEYQRRSGEIAKAAEAGASSVLYAERRILFGDSHAYGYVPGSAAVSLDEAQSIRDRLFQPTQATLIVVGDVSRAQVMASATRWFGAWKATGALPRNTTAARALNGPSVAVVPRRWLTQTQGAVFARGPEARSDDMEAFALAAQVVGGAASSKVFAQLRDEGAAYAVTAHVHRARVATWMSIDASYDREKAVDGTRDVLQAIDRLRTGGVSDDEVATAREMLLAQWRDSMATVQGAAGEYARAIGLGLGPATVRDYPARLAKVRREDLLRVANEYLASKALHVVFMGEERWLDPGSLGMGGAAILPLK